MQIFTLTILQTNYYTGTRVENSKYTHINSILAY